MGCGNHRFRFWTYCTDTTKPTPGCKSSGEAEPLCRCTLENYFEFMLSAAWRLTQALQMATTHRVTLHKHFRRFIICLRAGSRMCASPLGSCCVISASTWHRERCYFPSARHVIAPDRQSVYGREKLILPNQCNTLMTHEMLP